MLYSDGENDNSENSLDRNTKFSEENKDPLQNKYLDKRYSMIISEKSSYTSSSLIKSAMEDLRFDNKQSFITDSKISSDYFKDHSMSFKNSFRSNQKENKIKNELRNIDKKESNKKNEICEHEDCRTHTISHNRKTKRQIFLNILKI